MHQHARGLVAPSFFYFFFINSLTLIKLQSGALTQNTGDEVLLPSESTFLCSQTELKSFHKSRRRLQSSWLHAWGCVLISSVCYIDNILPGGIEWKRCSCTHTHPHPGLFSDSRDCYSDLSSLWEKANTILPDRMQRPQSSSSAVCSTSFFSSSLFLLLLYRLFLRSIIHPFFFFFNCFVILSLFADSFSFFPPPPPSGLVSRHT